MTQVLHQHEHKDKDDEIREYHFNKLKYLSEKCYRKMKRSTNEYSLDKEQTSFNDSLDALRLGLKGYSIK